MDQKQAGDEAEIVRLTDRIVEALAAKDLEALATVYAPDVVSFDVEPPLQHVGLEVKLANWRKVFAIFDTLTYELRDLTLRVGGRVAYGHGFGRISGKLGNGITTDGSWVRATFCFTKIDNAWLITHDQASLPVDMQTGRAVTDLVP